MSESFRNLKLLFNTMCLRRTETLLDLPPSTTETVLISHSPEETAAYEAILYDCRAEYERQACGKSELKSFNILFQTAQKLRMLCNHGTFVTSNQHQRPRNRSKSRELEMTGGDSCVFCCMDEDSSSSLIVHLHRFPVVPSPARSPTSSTAGYSSKLLTVAQNIEKHFNADGSKRYAQVPSSRQLNSLINHSVVFTSWRTTLNLLQILLTECSLPFLRIDGMVNATDRTAIIDNFSTNPDIPVLLLTINSGAVGLTITAANVVHLVEPIYNPAIEAQAVARVLRMGQTRPVKILRYVTEETIEPVRFLVAD
uniref:Helicase n=2 Tax=Podospora anserina (strain S / ATCC MYA-4624 / DSM 980 / FGSC 10383) TaxID=515849 RepID=A0A090CQN6_PODAN|nr:Putative Helicase [Podospora anserina S mat+]